MSIQTRTLKKPEFKQLIQEADSNETWGINHIEQPFDYLKDNCVESSGIIINGRPIYFAYLLKEGERYVLWTVVNQDVEAQFSLYKISKRIISEWVKKYGSIYATMRTTNPENIKWTKRIGFEVVGKDKDSITLKIGEN